MGYLPGGVCLRGGGVCHTFHPFENITLLQTSFAGGNKMKIRIFIGDRARVFTPQSMRFVTPFRGEFVRPVSHLDF